MVRTVRAATLVRETQLVRVKRNLGLVPYRCREGIADFRVSVRKVSLQNSASARLCRPPVPHLVQSSACGASTQVLIKHKRMHAMLLNLNCMRALGRGGLLHFPAASATNCPF